MSNSPLSKESADKIKQFFVKSDKFSKFMTDSFDKDPTFPKCYKDLKPAQKKKFISIVIQQMNFSNVFTKEGLPQPTAADVVAIKKAIDNDKDLGKKVT